MSIASDIPTPPDSSSDELFHDHRASLYWLAFSFMSLTQRWSRLMVASCLLVYASRLASISTCSAAHRSFAIRRSSLDCRSFSSIRLPANANH